MKRTPPPEFDTTWDGSLERDAVKAQQKPAPKLPGGRPPGVVRRAYAPRVRQLLETSPGKWWTFSGLTAATGFPELVVRDVVRRLIAAGWVESVPLPKQTAGGSYKQVRWRGEP